MPNVKKLYIGKSKLLRIVGEEIHAYLLEDLLTPSDLTALTTAFLHQFDNHDLIWDKTLIQVNGRSHGMGKQRNMGEQRYVKIFDVTQGIDYYYQTPDSIYNWAHDAARDSLPPIFYKVIRTLEHLGGLADDPGKWVPLRSHINVHEWEHCLEGHTDMDVNWFNVPVEHSRQFSVTIYLDELTLGGEFWGDTDEGFVYKPKANTALMIPGNKFFHGVNSNMDEFKRPRKAFTVRFAHVDTLYLPGHPDKHLYKPAFMDQITA